MSGFGRAGTVFCFWAQALALAPGLPGDYLRTCYYRLTLTSCAADSRISFGTFFSHPEAVVGNKVFIGSNSVIGRSRIGDRTHIATGVQILSGRRQHARDGQGNLQSPEDSTFRTVSVGADCWIGAGAIVAADVGAGSTIGAGAVVVKDIPEAVVAVGNPARVIKAAQSHA